MSLNNYKNSAKEIDYRKKYNETNYDRITVMAPKGIREYINEASISRYGAERSVSLYIKELLEKDIGKTFEELTGKEKQEPVPKDVILLDLFVKDIVDSCDTPGIFEIYHDKSLLAAGKSVDDFAENLLSSHIYRWKVKPNPIRIQIFV